MHIAHCIGMATVSALNAGSLLDFSYGVLEELRGKEDLAGEYYEKAYAADPTAMHLVRMIAEKRLAEGDRAAAFGIFQDAVGARPDEPMIRIEFGDFLGRIGKGDSIAEGKRREAYQQALAAMPGDHLPIERLIRQERELSNDNSAREYLERLRLDTPEAVRYYVATTKSLYDSKDKGARARIEKCFADAAENHPEWSSISRAASDHFREAGDMGKAISILRKHVAAVPSSLDLKIRLGILLLSEKEIGEGIAILKEVLEAHPGKSLAHESLAKQYRLQGKHEEARSHAAELLKIRGGTPDEFLELADELIADGEFRAARLLLEKAVFDRPEDAALMMKLAMASSRDPETKDKSARLFREAEAMLANPADMSPAFLLESARELVAQGQAKAAEERLRNAIRNFPKEAKNETAAAMRALADLWISEGRNTDAAKALISRAEALEK
ncbi:tetratricopeptide repeat protein [Akkermansiaceae bacterium]|nr:tetratricopeptide repeat protein [Akkermansiaceae bacterium]